MNFSLNLRSWLRGNRWPRDICKPLGPRLQVAPSNTCWPHYTLQGYFHNFPSPNKQSGSACIRQELHKQVERMAVLFPFPILMDFLAKLVLGPVIWTIARKAEQGWFEIRAVCPSGWGSELGMEFTATLLAGQKKGVKNKDITVRIYQEFRAGLG